MNSHTEKTHPVDTPPVDVQELVWAMLDEQISEDDFRRLDELLRHDEEARRLYLQCVQMHVDLMNYYAAKDTTTVSGSVGLPLSIALPSIDATLADPAV
jgi:ribosomal protein L1